MLYLFQFFTRTTFTITFFNEKLVFDSTNIWKILSVIKHYDEIQNYDKIQNYFYRTLIKLLHVYRNM